MAKLRILLTGADGLIGSHILNQLLVQDAVSVRAVVATQTAAASLQYQYQNLISSSLDLDIVAERNIKVPGIFDDVLDGASEPFHAAIYTCKAAPFDDADCLARHINLETETVINFLRSVRDVASGVTRVVVVTTLSSFARWLAVPQDGRSVSGSFAIGSPNPSHILATSQASDNVVHEAVSRWTKESGSRFDLVWITAPSVYGPSVRPLNNSSDVLESNRRIWNICSGESRDAAAHPPCGVVHFLDVRDLAVATIRGLFTKPAANKRFVVSAGVMLSEPEMAYYLVAHFPELEGLIRAERSPPRQSHDRDHSPEFLDTYLVHTVLGIAHFISAEKTSADTTQQILDLQRRKSWKSVTQS